VFLSGNSRSIVFQDDRGVRQRFDIDQVQSLDFMGGGDLTGSNRYNNGVSTPNRNGSYSGRADRLAGADGYSLPAGTEIQVRTNENIDSSTATEGRAYSAEINRDVTDASGSVVLPRGSDAQLVIRSLNTSTTAGSPEFTLDLQSVTANGRRYLISTEDVARSNERGLGTNRRTAEYVGGGAVLGTLLGAIAGGGKGAAIGAAAGAAAGAGAQVLTKGKEVKVPAETQLTFRLDQPLRLQAGR
jgi:hypothetical protein